MSRHIPLTIAGSLLALLVSAPPARADAIIDFSTESSDSGSIGYAGGSAPLVGTNIPIAYLVSVDTPDNDGAYLPIGGDAGTGLLNFTTGAFEGLSGGQYQFGSGGTFTITGTVPDAGVLLSSTLLSGSIDYATIGHVGLVNLTTTSGSDGIALNSQLLDFFGLTPSAAFTTFSLEMASGSVAGASFTVPVFHTDWQAVASEDEVSAQASTPEPASLVLLASGLFVMGSMLRRRGGTQVRTARRANFS